MKKILVMLTLVVLAGCSLDNPEMIRPYINGPVYYKQHTCETYKMYPTQIKRWNYEIGMEETYITYEKVPERTICNYNKGNLNSLYGNM